MNPARDLAQYVAGRSAFHVCEPETLVLVIGARASDAHAFVCGACAESGMADGTYADVPTPETIYTPVTLATLSNGTARGTYAWTWTKTQDEECFECGRREAGNVECNGETITARVCYRCAVSIVDECHANVLAEMLADEREAADFARINA